MREVGLQQKQRTANCKWFQGCGRGLFQGNICRDYPSKTTRLMTAVAPTEIQTGTCRIRVGVNTASPNVLSIKM